MTDFELRSIHDGFGVEVIGLGPVDAIDAGKREVLRKAFDERGVLVIRDLDITYAEQDKLCRMVIGDNAAAPAVDRGPQLVSNKEENASAPYGRLMFHADTMWAPTPLEVISLYATDVAPGSAATLLASGLRALETLPGDLRARIEGMVALQDRDHVYSRGDHEVLRSHNETKVSTPKPLIHPHPRTGKPILYVSEQNTSGIVGMSKEESEPLLQQLFEHLYADDNVHVHEWRNGDLLLFDNFSMQHSRRHVDAHGPTRTLRKVIAPVPAVAAARPTFDQV
jgi:alpha-ketoglutarate-dependent taurine dioxygenase